MRILEKLEQTKQQARELEALIQNYSEVENRLYQFQNHPVYRKQYLAERLQIVSMIREICLVNHQLVEAYGFSEYGSKI